jgi:hypothetical protein
MLVIPLITTFVEEGEGERTIDTPVILVYLLIESGDIIQFGNSECDYAASTIRGDPR